MIFRFKFIFKKLLFLFTFFSIAPKLLAQLTKFVAKTYKYFNYLCNSAFFFNQVIKRDILKYLRYYTRSRKKIQKRIGTFLKILSIKKYHCDDFFHLTQFFIMFELLQIIRTFFDTTLDTKC